MNPPQLDLHPWDVCPVFRVSMEMASISNWMEVFSSEIYEFSQTTCSSKYPIENLKGLSQVRLVAVKIHPQRVLHTDCTGLSSGKRHEESKVLHC
jgi:hypothetical protein